MQRLVNEIMIEQVRYNQILPLIKMAYDEGVAILETDAIYAVREDYGIVALGCIRQIGKRRARLCGAWTMPEMRGRGYGRAIVEHRLGEIRNVSVIDTFAFYPSLFLSLGFRELRTYQIGTTWLVKEL